MNICRLCLGTAGEMLIFDEQRASLNKFLTYCRLKMEKEDGLPQYSCLCCLQKLESVVTFMKQCEDSDRVLRKNLDIGYFKRDKKVISHELMLDLKSFSLDYSSDDDNQYSDANNDDFSNDLSEEITKKKVKNTADRSKTVSKNVKKDTDTTENVTNENTEKIDANDSEIDDFWAEFDVKPVSVKKIKVPSGYLCYHCGKEFAPGQCTAYRNHIVNYHSEKKFKCDKCHRVFFTQLLLNAHHLNFHQNGGKRFACDMCDRKYESRRRLRNHKETIHLKSISYECDVCSKVFHNKNYLRAHQKKHTTEGEAKCTFCNKVFCNKTWLNKHMRSHTGERPYSCSFCDSKFSISQTLREHERLHTGEKPFKCPACLKGFSQSGNMKSHFKYNHRELDFKETRTAFQQKLKNKKVTKISNDANVLEIEYIK